MLIQKVGMVLAKTGHTNFDTKKRPMKNVMLPFFGFFVLTVASCKKDDFKESNATTVATTTNTDQSTGWNPVTQWEVADQGTFSVRYVTINDSAITADVADNGLVLLYKKSGNTINALPFEEGTAGNTQSVTDASGSTPANYWYHQVAEGSLLISCDQYTKTAAPDAANNFKYFVITPAKLQHLQTNGYTPEKLMDLSYADAATLLQNAE